MSRELIVNLPDIGEGVVEGEIIDWLKAEGENVKQDEPVVVVMTDKATVELPAPMPGKVSKHYLKPGEIAIKGKPVYSIEIAEGSVLPASHPNKAPKKGSPSQKNEPSEKKTYFNVFEKRKLYK